MTRARILLHLAALLLPALVALGWSALLAHRGGVDEVVGLASVSGLAAVVAGQCAALLCWRLFVRRARERRAWLAGLAMALVSHLVFGPVVVVGMIVLIGTTQWLGSGSPFDALWQSLFFSAASLLVAGAVTLPLVAAIAQWIGRPLAAEVVDGIA